MKCSKTSCPHNAEGFCPLVGVPACKERMVHSHTRQPDVDGGVIPWDYLPGFKPVWFKEESVVCYGRGYLVHDVPVLHPQYGVTTCWKMSLADRLRCLIHGKVYVWLYAPANPAMAIASQDRGKLNEEDRL